MNRLLRRLLSLTTFLTLSLGVGLTLATPQEGVGARAAAGDIITTWNDKASGYTSGYKSQSAIIDGREWLMTMGQSGYLGANKATNHDLSKFTDDALNAAKAVDSTWTSTKTGMYGVIAKTTIPNVNKIEFAYTANDGNSASTEVYLAQSSSLTSIYQLVPLTTGSQGSTPGTSRIVTYTFNTVSSAYYAVLFKTGSAARFTSATIKFFEGSNATGTISFNNSSERIQLGNDLVLTPTLGGTGTLEASVTDSSVTSLYVSSTQVTLNALKVGTTKLTATYGGSQAQVDIEVFDPYVTLSKQTTTIQPLGQVSITATPTDFTPTSYLWTKDDVSSLLTMSGETTQTATFTAGATLGEVVATVQASNGTVIRSASVTIRIATQSEGTYTITSATTTYTATPTIANLNVAKTDAELGAITLTNLNNFRLGASGSGGDNSVISKLMFGASATVAGSATFTLPEGLYATSVKFTGLTSSNDTGTTPTLSVNGVLKYTLSPSVTEVTTKVYANALTIATANRRIWVGSIEITAKTLANAALDFGTYLLNKTAAECNNLNVLNATWNEMSTIYTSADASIKNTIKATSVNNDGNDLEKALGRYDFISQKYGYTDFIGYNVSPRSNFDLVNDSSNTIAIITLLSFLGLSSILGYSFLKKKKQLD